MASSIRQSGRYDGCRVLALSCGQGGGLANSSGAIVGSTVPGLEPVSRTPREWILARIDLLLRLGLVLIIVVEAIFFTLRTIPSGSLSDISSSTFISGSNLQNVGRQMAVNGVLAVGETFVIITAGIDLSVGSLVAVAGMIAAVSLADGWGIFPVVALVMGLSLLVGIINGLLVGVAKIPPFIATLGMLGVLRGACYLINPQSVSLSTPAGLNFSNWVIDSFHGLPTIFLALLIIALIGGVFLRFTRRGRYIYALGSNPESARRVGINVLATLLTVYVISALLAGIGGLLLTGRLGGANPTNAVGYELDAIAPVVLGGGSLFGARGSIFGTMLGVVLVNVLSNGLDLINADPHVQQIVEGGLLIAIVWVDQWRKGRASNG